MDLSILDNFHELQSPVSGRRLDFEEFADASTPMQSSYCRQMTEDEYTTTGETETEKALQELISHMEKNPESLMKVLRKRRVEEVENAGFFSMLKCRLMTKLRGEEYVNDLLSKDECEKRRRELTNGMMVVHNYSKVSFQVTSKNAKTQSLVTKAVWQRIPGRRARNSKTLTTIAVQVIPLSLPSLRATRHSSRLAERKMKSASGTGSEECDLVTPSLCRRGIHENKTSQGPPPPPPPPPPPLPAIHDSAVRNVMPLKERNVNQNADRMTQIKARKPATQNAPSSSSSAVNSVCEELMQCDPATRLRSTQIPRSPGGTPAVNSSKSQSTDSLSWSGPLNSPEPMHAALLRLLNQKFRNVRSPSPVHAGPDATSPQAFSP